MTKFIKKPVAVEAYQWYEVSPYKRGVERDVDYYRTPDVDGNDNCKHCGDIMHNHGWIDTLQGGHIVCPKDWVITGMHGEKYPCKPDIFKEWYYTEDKYAIEYGQLENHKQIIARAYHDEPLSFKQILESNKIENAVWCLTLLPYIDTCLFGADIAEIALNTYRYKHLEDNRSRLSIEAIRNFHAGKITEAELNVAEKNAYAATNRDDAAYVACIAANSDETIDTICVAYVNTTDSVEDDKRKKWAVIEELFIEHFV